MRGPSSHFVPPKYDNRFVLDLTVAAWLLLLSALLFVLYEAVLLYIDYENSCSQFLCGSLGLVLASALLFFIASMLLAYISQPEELEFDLACVEEFAVIDSIEKRKSWGERFLYGHRLLVYMWLLLLAVVPLFVLVVWAYAAGQISTGYFVSYFLLVLFVALVSIFWVVAMFPENMILNNGRGSSFFYDAFLSCCCGSLHHLQGQGQGVDEIETCAVFWSKHAGSDLLVGSWLFFGGAGIALAVAVYYTYEEWTNVLIYLVLVSSVLLFVGSAFLVAASYPGQMFSRYWWCTFTCQKGERWDVQSSSGGRRQGGSGGEARRLI